MVQSAQLCANGTSLQACRSATDASTRFERRNYMLYGLPVTRLQIDFAHAKDGRWTVGASANTVPDSDPLNWFQLTYSTNLLTSDNFTLTVADGLLNTANASSEPQTVEILSQLGNLRDTIDFFSEPFAPGIEPADPAVPTAGGPDGAPVYSTSYALRSSQASCLLASETISVCPPAEIGSLILEVTRSCTASAPLPGREVSVGECGDNLRRTHRQDVGSIGLAVIRRPAGHGDSPSVRQAMGRLYVDIGQNSDRSTYFRLAAPDRFDVSFHCLSSVSPDGAAMTNAAAAAIDRACPSDPDTFGETLRSEISMVVPAFQLNTIVMGPPGHAMSADMFATAVSSDATSLTFSDGVLTSVTVDRDPVSLGALLVTIAAISLAANDD
jgi:hypothetical protein